MTKVVQRSTVVSVFMLVVLALLASSVTQRYVGHVMGEPDLDFLDYYFEAAMVHDAPQTPMYTPALQGNPQLKWSPPDSEVFQRAEAAGFNGTNLYLYPPLLADMLVPVVRVGPHRAALLWRLCNLLVVLLTVGLLAQFAGLRLRSAQAALLLFCAYACWPVHETIAQGQISIVLMGLWTVGIVAFARDKGTLSAVAFALATWLKVTPLLLVAVFLVLQQWRWIRDYLLTTLAVGVLIERYNGRANLLQCLQVLRNMSGSVPALGNKCISSLLWWFRIGYPATPAQARVLINQPQSPAFLLVCKGASCAFLLVCLFLVWRRRVHSTRIDRAMMLAVFALVLPLVSPVSWRHTYAAGLPLLTLLWVRALHSPSVSVVRAALLAVTTLAMGSLCFDLAAQVGLPRPLPVLLAAVWPVSCMLLCVHVLWREPSMTELVPVFNPEMQVASPTY